MKLIDDDPIPRRFQLFSDTEAGGTSGRGIVATGVCWPDGVSVIHWNTEISPTTVFECIHHVLTATEHRGSTLMWLDYADDGSSEPPPCLHKRALDPG